MEFVFRHPEGQPYGGPDVGVNGERYDVIREGSRQLIRGVPAYKEAELAGHGWFPTGVANADIVEVSAREALAEKAKADNLELALKQAKQSAKSAADRADRIAKEKALEAKKASEDDKSEGEK